MIANIAGDDDLILPHSANPTGSNFREQQVVDIATGQVGVKKRGKTNFVETLKERV
jgi:hypothetical protein